MSNRRTTRGNRLGLTLVGLVLLVGGALALARGLGAFASAVPVLGTLPAHGPLLTPDTSRYADTHAWFWPVVAAVAVIAATLALRWLLVQARTQNIHYFQLEPDRSRGQTRLPAAAVTGGLEDEIGSYPGVRAVTARLTQSPSRPRLDVTVALEERADLPRLRRRLTDEAVPHTRAVLDLEELPTLVRLRLDAAAARRRTQ